MFTVILISAITISVIANVVVCFTCLHVASVADKASELYFNNIIDSCNENQCSCNDCHCTNKESDCNESN